MIEIEAALGSESIGSNGKPLRLAWGKKIWRIFMSQEQCNHTRTERDLYEHMDQIKENCLKEASEYIGVVY